MSDVSAATGTVNGGTPAPGSVISSSSPGSASRIEPSDSGIECARRGQRELPAVARLEVLHRGVARERFELGRVATATVAHEDVRRRHGLGRGDAVDRGEGLQVRIRDRGRERDLRTHLFEAAGGVERRLGRVDDTAGSDDTDHRRGRRDRGDERRAGAECLVAPDLEQPPEPQRERAGEQREAEADRGDEQIARTHVLGKVDGVRQRGPRDGGAEQPEDDAADTTGDDGDGERPTASAVVVDPGGRERGDQRGHDESEARHDDARLAEPGLLFLDDAVGRLRAAWLDQLGVVRIRDLGEAGVEGGAVLARRVADEHLGDGGLPAELLDDGLRREQHREAAGGRDHLLLALRGQQVLGGEPDADDVEIPGHPDAEGLDLIAGLHVQVVGGVLLDDGDRSAGAAIERVARGDRRPVDARARWPGRR